MSRREYDVIGISINGLKITKVIIDPHYIAKHADSINDEVILALVRMLNDKFFAPEEVNSPYFYFTNDKIMLDGKSYKLVWLLEERKIYIGVINAYRRSK